MAKISLKPVQKRLQDILKKLRKEAKRPHLTPKQKKILSRDIKNLKKLIQSIPPICFSHFPPYDLGI